MEKRDRIEKTRCKKRDFLTRVKEKGEKRAQAKDRQEMWRLNWKFKELRVTKKCTQEELELARSGLEILALSEDSKNKSYAESSKPSLQCGGVDKIMHVVTDGEKHVVTDGEKHVVTNEEKYVVINGEKHVVDGRDMHVVMVREMHVVREKHVVMDREMGDGEMHVVTDREMQDVTGRGMSQTSSPGVGISYNIIPGDNAGEMNPASQPSGGGLGGGGGPYHHASHE